jgi:hypothetical protein
LGAKVCNKLHDVLLWSNTALIEFLLGDCLFSVLWVFFFLALDLKLLAPKCNRRDAQVTGPPLTRTKTLCGFLEATPLTIRTYVPMDPAQVGQRGRILVVVLVFLVLLFLL